MKQFAHDGMFKRGRALCQLLVLTILCLTTSLLFAQFDTGTINGTVTDPSGAAIAKATVTATNIGTGTDSTATTDASGNFVDLGFALRKLHGEGEFRWLCRSEKFHHHFERRCGRPRHPQNGGGGLATERRRHRYGQHG